ARVVPVSELAAATPPAPAALGAGAADLADAYPAPPSRTTTVFAILRADGSLYVDADDMAAGRKYTTYPQQEDADTVAEELARGAALRGFTGATFTVVSQTFTTVATDWQRA